MSNDTKIIPDVLNVDFKNKKVISVDDKEMTAAELNDKAELTLLTEMMKLPSRQARKAFAVHIGISWEEYQYLLHKWKHLINRTMRAGKQLTKKEYEADD
jgi:hypothetical protein